MSNPIVDQHKKTCDVCAWRFLLAFLLFGLAANGARAEPISTRFLKNIDTQVRSIILSDVPIVNFDRSSLGQGGLATSSFGSVETQAIGLVVAIAMKAAAATVGRSVTNSRQEKAAELVIPLVNSVRGYSFRAEFRDDLAGRISVIPPIGENPLLSVDTADQIGSIRDKAAQSLEIVTAPFLSQDAERLVVVTEVELYYPGMERPAASRHLVYFSDMIESEGDARIAISKWSDNDAMLYKQACADATRATMKMFDRAMSGTAPGEAGKQVKKKKLIAPDTWFHKRKYSGILFYAEDNRVIFDTTRGPIFSLPASVVDE